MSSLMRILAILYLMKMACRYILKGRRFSIEFFGIHTRIKTSGPRSGLFRIAGFFRFWSLTSLKR